MVISKRSRFLVALDGSEQSLNTVEYIAGMIPSQDMDVVLFHVMPQLPNSYWDAEKTPHWERDALPPAWEEHRLDAVREFMDAAQQMLIRAGVPRDRVQIKIQARVQGIARDISSESETGYDALFMGRIGSTTLQDLVIGSIANKLLSRLSRINMIVVKGRPEVGRLLLAFDASEGAWRALDFVGSLMAGTAARITIFHALRGLHSGPPTEDEPLEAQRRLDVHREKMQAVLETARTRLLQADIEADRVSVKIDVGAPSRAGAIIQESLIGRYGTLVVGRRGVSEVNEFAMGGVSNKLIHLARDMAVWVVC